MGPLVAGALLTLAIGLCVPAAPLRASVELVAFDVRDGGDRQSVALAEPAPVPLSLGAAVDSVNALPAVPESFDYGRLVRSRHETGPLDTGLLGESIDYYTGQVDFVATDVSLPGTSALPVAVGRRYHVVNRAGGVLQGAFGDWDLDIPHVEGVIAANVGWTVPGTYTDARCTYFGAPAPAVVTTQTSSTTVTTNVPASEYAFGFSAVIPGLGRHELLLRATGTPAQSTTNDRVTTQELWAISCVERSASPVPGQPDEGFVVTTPDGVTYTFKQGLVRPYPPLARPADTPVAGVVATVDRREVWMLPTQVKDRFGNTVNYTYEPGSTQGIMNLKRIEANDGRHLDLTYASGRVSTITDGTRTWTYTYGATSGYLHGVTLPDSSSWVIDFDNLNTANWNNATPTCTSLPPATLTSDITASIQHPTGATGTFTFKVNRRGRSGTPANCVQNSANVAFAPVEPSVYDVVALTRKQITGPGITGTPTWTIGYAGCSSSSTNACDATSKTTVTDPRGYKTEYTFGAKYGANGTGDEGQLQRIQSGGSGTTYLQDETYTYFAASGHTYPAVLGAPSQLRGDVSALSSLRPVQSRTLTRDGATYTRTMADPDDYGFPKTITRTGTATQTEKITYQHNTTDWVLGTVARLHAGDVQSQDDYELTFNSHSQPLTVKRFGRLVQTLDYNSDGTLKWIQDADDTTRRTKFDLYRYGIPRSIKYADGSEETAVVDVPGQVKSSTNAMGHVTGYQYDAMGRLKKITPPAGYNPTTVTWNPDYSSGWTRTVTTGAAWTKDTYDALLRPVRTDDSRGRTIRRRFDIDGHPTFVSQPNEQFIGIDYEYDGLGRLTHEQQGLTYQSTLTYTANKLSIKDRNSHFSDVSYMAYDTPTNAWPLVSHDGNGTATTIVRDAWGKPKDIQRGTLHRRFDYHTDQLLKSIAEPETGTRTFAYYTTGTLKTVTHADGVVETRSYDKRNRLTGIVYDDGTAGVTRTWRLDGQPDTATHDGIARGWQYDSADLLTGETIAIGGTTYALGYAYDLNRHVKTITYPDNVALDLSPDADGYPSKAGAYATGVTYHFNDAIDGFTYGNGIVHDLTQDERLLPKTVKDTGVLSATYGYDKNGNPTSITDTVAASRNRTLTYDSADRLKTATGPWGTTTLTLDDQDNLTGDSGQNLSLTIDATSNRPSGSAFTWDARGRLKQKGSGANALHYTFDSANLLTGVTQGATTRAYAYDALGLRARASGGPQTTVSVYGSAGRLMYEVQAAATNPDLIFRNGFETVPPPSSTTKYLYLGNHLVAKETKAGSTTTVLYQHTDALGTPVAQTNASKQVVSTATYWPYGTAYQNSGSPTGPGYASQYLDDTGLIYMRARYYDPQLHRFISPDPLEADAVNYNRYAYANNSPFRYYDPSGRSSKDPDDEGDGDDDPPADPGDADPDEADPGEDDSGCAEAEDLCPKGSPQLAGIRKVQAGIETGVKMADDAAMMVVESAAMAAVPQVGALKKLEEAAVGAKKLIGAGEEAAAAIKAGAAGGETAGKVFPNSVKTAARNENPDAICVYCRRPGTGSQIDHSIPKSRGGDATINNAQLACPHCNASKGAGDFPKNPPPGYEGPWPPPWW